MFAVAARWEDSHRTMVVYKESQELAKKDPALEEWTGTWRDGRSINPLGPQPENSLTGTIFTVNAWRHDALEIPAHFSKLRFWRHTSVQQLKEVFNITNIQYKIVLESYLVEGAD